EDAVALVVDACGQGEASAVDLVEDVADGDLVALGEVDGGGVAVGVAEGELSAGDALSASQSVEAGALVDVLELEVAAVGGGGGEGAGQTQVGGGGAGGVGDDQVAGGRAGVVGQEQS